MAVTSGQSRSAQHTIAGYHYQFDKSIIEILRATGGEKVTLEGIEDVDVEGDCIQCKYHGAKRYARSLIKKPMLAFLSHFAAHGGNKNYVLYAHFRESTQPPTIDLHELKRILGSEREAVPLPDHNLENFLCNHFRFVPGVDIDQQHELVLLEIGKALQVNRDDCEQYFYGNALHEVIRISRQNQLEGRATTRSDFLKVIDKKQVVLSRWIAQLRGQVNYREYLRDRLKALDALRSTKLRLIFLGSNPPEEYSTGNLALFCRTMVDRFYPVGRVLHDALPLAILIDRPPKEVFAVQKQLVEWDILVNTGYEAIGFQSKVFNERPVINRKSGPNRKAGDKVSKASYSIRVINADTFRMHAKNIEPPDTLIVFGRPRDSDYLLFGDAQVISIADADSLTSLAGILTP